MGRVLGAPPLMFGRFKLDNRMAVLEERQAKAERRLNDMEIEWANTYDKLRTTMLRVVKRSQKDPMPSPPEESGGLEAGAEPGSGNTLTARQLAINAQIQMRRNRRNQ